MGEYVCVCVAVSFLINLDTQIERGGEAGRGREGWRGRERRARERETCQGDAGQSDVAA